MRKRNVIVLVAATGLWLAACGSSEGNGGGVASLGTSTGTVAGGAEADEATLEAPEDPQEAMALFQECMEDQGIEMPESVAVTRDGDATIAVGGGPLVISNDNGGGDSGDGAADEDPVDVPDFDVDEFEAANEECRGHLANATAGFDLTPEQEAAMEDARLEFDQCMEEQGVELPEMTGGEDDIGVHVEVVEEGDGSPAPPPIDVEELAAASKVCQKVYDQYPELDDVFGDGGAGAPMVIAGEAGEP